MRTTNPAAVVVLVLMALIVATGCASGPSLLAKRSPSLATSTPTPATPAFDDHFGFLIGNAVRVESDPQPLFTLGIPNYSGGLVSPDGSRLAYWDKKELRVIDIAPGTQPQTVLAITGKGESALYFAWSTDGSGLIVGVNGGGGGQADAPPGYTALRVVDAWGGSPVREIVRVRNANVIPLIWDRYARFVEGYIPTGSSTGIYYVTKEDATRTSTIAWPGVNGVQASQDGQWVLGRGDTNGVLHVSQRAGVTTQGTFLDTGGEPILDAAWRPGTHEVDVLLAERLELREVFGGPRTIPLPPHANGKSLLVFRADGKTAFAVGADVIAVDIASGRSSVLQWSGPMPEPGRSVRIAP